jgi:hypothetical protein
MPLNSNGLGIGWHVSVVTDPVNGQLDEFPIAHL